METVEIRGVDLQNKWKISWKLHLLCIPHSTHCGNWIFPFSTRPCGNEIRRYLFSGTGRENFFILTFPQPVETAVENCTFSVKFCGYAKLARIIPPISTVQTSWKTKVSSGVTLAANVLDDILYQLL